MSAITDIHASVVADAKLGKRQAQTQLYGLYAQGMFSVANRIVTDQQEAEDVVQESFISAFGRLNSFRGETTFGAWLKRIVINKALDKVNKKSLETTELEDRHTNHTEESEPGTYKPEYTVDMVKRAINDLPDGYRIILSLYLLEGYDHEEISDILNISGSTSRSQFLRAKKRLRSELNKMNYA